MVSKTSKPNIKNPSTVILVVLLVVSAFAIGILWQRLVNLEKSRGVSVKAPGKEQATKKEPEKPRPTPVIKKMTEKDHVRGNRNADIIWIEYSDFECPYCGRIHPDLVKLMDEYKGNIAWVYRHFPLDSIHPNARSLSIASECVAKLAGEDAFWEFTDALYKNQGSADKEELAVNAGVGKDKFNKCLEDESVAQKVEDDYQSGIAAGVSGTPGNIILNKAGEHELIPGALPYEQLKITVEKLLGS